MAILPSIFRVHWWYGGCTRGGSALHLHLHLHLHLQLGLPHLVVRSTSEPGRAKAASEKRLAIVS